MTTGQVLADQIRRTREWTILLLVDLAGDDWTWQPFPGAQHALWICGHVASAQQQLVFGRCLGQEDLDSEFMDHFAIGGPIKSAEEHDWPSPDVVRRQMDKVQSQTEEAVVGLSDSFLAEPAFGKGGVPHPHYDTKLGAIGHVVRHEAFHAGQLAMLRRLRGKPFLR